MNTSLHGVLCLPAEGKHKGRRPTVAMQGEAIRVRIAQGEKPAALARSLGVACSSIYRMLGGATRCLASQTLRVRYMISLDPQGGVMNSGISIQTIRGLLFCGLLGAGIAAIGLVLQPDKRQTQAAASAPGPPLPSRYLCTPTGDVGFDAGRQPIIRPPGAPFIVRMATPHDRKPPTIVQPRETWVAYDRGGKYPFVSGIEEAYGVSPELQLSGSGEYLSLDLQSMKFSRTLMLLHADPETIYVRLNSGEYAHFVIGKCTAAQ